MRQGAAVVLALAASAVGCGGAGDTARDAASETGIFGLARHLCTPGQDQTCNDDPAMSALAGRCLDSGYCQCNEGFSRDLDAGRCRAGTACTASAGDPWPDKLSLAIDDCAMRPAAQCVPSATGDPADYNAIADVARRECAFPPYAVLRVELTGGCATLLELSADTTIEAQLLQCLEKVLSAARWDCAAPMACVLYEYGVTI